MAYAGTDDWRTALMDGNILMSNIGPMGGGDDDHDDDGNAAANQLTYDDGNEGGGRGG